MYVAFEIQIFPCLFICDNNYYIFPLRVLFFMEVAMYNWFSLCKETNDGAKKIILKHGNFECNFNLFQHRLPYTETWDVCLENEYLNAF